ncbi:class I SAM-dependent methyltransferase [Brevundimonas sp.]|uniref:class I SAM-dependent methyltransferase n=1 Tax=Brevundimonas sp. TaxID=1871086 RepID=UPI003D6CF8D7
MNLHYLLSNAHRRLLTHEAASISSKKIEGRKWRGVTLPAGTGAGLTVLRATECNPFKQRPATVGWYAYADGDAGKMRVNVRCSGTGEILGSSVMRPAINLQEIHIPWPREPFAGPLDVEVAADPTTTGDIFVANNTVLDRSQFVQMCSGTGVEIGPGPRPQVLPSDGLSVTYVEQTHPDKWGEMYASGKSVSFDPALSKHYVVGDAHFIPAEPETLDFIFSSHVFEHLANPLGHLERWASLLKPGGRIVMVVPDYIGSKDFLMEETTIAELEEEYASRSFDVLPRHYEAYGKARESQDLARKLEASQASIHVHFYSNAGMSRVCEWAVEKLGYSAFSIEHVDNTKDFHVCLMKG